MAFEVRSDAGYVISDDPSRFDLNRAHGWIAAESYWAVGIPLATFEKATRNSLTFAAHASDGTMAAFGCVVTDRATFGWLCDVFVDEAHRGAGLGKALVEYFKAHPDLQLPPHAPGHPRRPQPLRPIRLWAPDRGGSLDGDQGSGCVPAGVRVRPRPSTGSG